MSKTTSKRQVQLLVSLMEAQPAIACNFYKGNKENIAKFWREAEAQLNSMGPPTKSILEWKKVWADQKKYVRQKASQNLKALKGTGGDRNFECKLSPTELAIYELIGMKKSVEGLAVRTFGLNSSTASIDTEYEDVSMLEIEYLDEPLKKITESPKIFPNTNQNINSKCSSPLNVFAEEINEPLKQKPPISKSTETVNKKCSPSDILTEELTVQKDLCKTMKAVEEDLKEHLQNSKKIYRALDSLCDIQKEHFQTMESIKIKECEETKRHNLVMEKLRMEEVECKIDKNRRLFHNEELKYNKYKY